MERRQVQSQATAAVPADQVWAVVQDFCAPWHPLIETMEPEAGGAIRRFTTKGDETVYRERLTWFSNTERAMRYTHLEGIADVERYDAELTVNATETGATVTMCATFSADAERAAEIAQGTQSIFDVGTARIVELAKTTTAIAPKPAAIPSVETRRIEIDGSVSLVLTTAGRETDTLLLFLHGIGGNRSNWMHQIAALAPLTQVAALDLRGYGESTLAMSQSTIDDYCDDILLVMDSLGARKLILCGLSYGAWIATSFAHQHPDKLTALIMSGGCTGMSEASPQERNAFLKSREVPISEGQTPADFALSVVNVIAGLEASEEIRTTLRRSIEAIPTETYADALRCFTNPPERFDFRTLTMPVLLMTGEYDKLAPPQEIKSVAKRIWEASPVPDVQFEIVEGAGHVCNLENPDGYNRVLYSFVSRVLQ